MLSQPISECGQVSVTDEAFTELALRNYWDKWTKGRPAKWTDARGGNTAFKGWREAAYDQFEIVCQRVRQQREPDQCEGQEAQFMSYAMEIYGATGGVRKRKRPSDAEGDRDIFNEL